MGRKFEDELAARNAGTTVAEIRLEKEARRKSPLPRHVAPILVVGLGCAFIISSLFLPFLSST